MMPYSPDSFVFLHVIGALCLLIGLLFLLRLAFKMLTDKQLKSWGLGLVAVGLVLCLLSMAAGFGARGGYRMMNGGNVSYGGSVTTGPGMMRNRDMRDMMDWNNSNESVSTADMSMSDMTSDLKGRTGDDFDTVFLDDMIAHHQGAIDMANAAKASAKHPEIKSMADAIISAQQKEIDQMKAWQTAWGYSK